MSSINPLLAINTQNLDDLDFLDVQEDRLIISRKRKLGKKVELDERIQKVDDFLNLHTDLLTQYLETLEQPSLLNLVGRIYEYHERCLRDGKDVDRKAEMQMFRHLLYKQIPEDLIYTLAESERFNIEFLKLMSGITEMGEKRVILEAIAKIPEADRASVIQYSLPLLINSAGYESKLILEIVARIPQEERMDIIKQTVPLMKEVVIDKHVILETVAKIPASDRADVLKRSFPLMKEVEFGNDRKQLIETVAILEKADREDVIKQATPLMNGLNSEKKKAILAAVANIPKEDREDIVKLTKPLVSGIQYGSKIREILEAVNKIEKGRRADLIKDALPFINQINASKRGLFLEAFAKIPEKDRENAVKEAIPLLVGIDSASEFQSILGTVASLEKMDREKIILYAKPLLNQATRDKTSVILGVVANIQEIDREDVMKHFYPLINEIKNLPDQLFVLDLLSKTHKSDRERTIVECRKIIPQGEFKLKESLMIQAYLISKVKSPIWLDFHKMVSLLKKLTPEDLLPILTLQDEEGINILEKYNNFKIALPLLEKLDRASLIALLKGPYKDGYTLLHNPQILKIARDLIKKHQIDLNDFPANNGLTPLDYQSTFDPLWIDRPKINPELDQAISDEEYEERSRQVSKELLNLWDALEFKTTFQDPQENKLSLVYLEVEGKIYTPAEIREKLVDMFNKLQNSTPWLGTPNAENIEALKEFYKEMLIAFEDIAAVLSSKQDPKFTAGLLVSLATPAIEGRCGTAYIDELDQKLEVIRPEKSLDIKKRFEDAANKALRKIIENLSKDNDSDVHVSRQLKYVCGFLKIPDPLTPIDVKEGQEMIYVSLKLEPFLKDLGAKFPEEFCDLYFADIVPKSYEKGLLSLLDNVEEDELALRNEILEILDQTMSDNKAQKVFEKVSVMRTSFATLSQLKFSSAEKGALLEKVLQEWQTKLEIELKDLLPTDLGQFSSEDLVSFKEALDSRLMDRSPLASLTPEERMRLRPQELQTIVQQRTQKLREAQVLLKTMQAILSFDSEIKAMELSPQERLAAFQGRILWEKKLSQIGEKLDAEEISFDQKSHGTPSSAIRQERTNRYIRAFVGTTYYKKLLAIAQMEGILK